MRETAAVRITADVSFFFTVMLMLVLPVRENVLPFVLAVALMFAADTYAAKFDQFYVRLGLSLIPAISLIFAGSELAMLMIGIGVLYSALLMTSGRFGMESWTYRRLYYVMAVPTIAMMIITCTLRTLRPGVMIFGAIFLLLGVIALNEMRMGAAADRKWRLYNAAQILIPAVAVMTGLFIFAKLFLLAGPLVKTFLAPFAYVLYLLTSLLARIGPSHMPQPEETTTTEIEETIEEILETQTPSRPPKTKPPVYAPEPPWEEIGIVLLVLLVLYIIWRIFKANYHPEKRESEAYLVDSEAFKPEKKKAAVRKARGNAERVRRTYRNYLKAIGRQGIVVKESRTSEEVLDLLWTRQKADEELRRIYIKARYGDGANVTDEDVKRAAQCLDELKKSRG